MKKILLSIIIAFSFLGINTVYGVDPSDVTEETEGVGSAQEAVNGGNGSGSLTIPYCSGEYCDFQSGLQDAGERINGIQDSRDSDISDYVQQVVSYLIGFIYLVAVILIIYAGFLILVSAGEEENVNKGKDIIKYTIIGVVLIYLANSIVEFILNILGQ